MPWDLKDVQADLFTFLHLLNRALTKALDGGSAGSSDGQILSALRKLVANKKSR